MPPSNHHSKMKLQSPVMSSSCAFLSILLFLIHAILLYSAGLWQPTAASIIRNAALGNETDRFALLKLKELISNDPHLVLSSWNDSVHFCNWSGILCGRRHQRVTALDLDGYNLRGTISPYIGNLSFLRYLILRNNSFFGEIPQQVTCLFRLRHLDLSHNYMLEGKIPANLSYCSKLEILSLETNRLTGIIPLELGSLVKLVHLNLQSNNLTGGIPASLGNISSLEILSVAYNNLAGTIPLELGRLKSLTEFIVGANYNLSGMIPPSLYNMSSMRTFVLTRCRFNGSLPPNIGITLPSLQEFEIAGNKFYGVIPESLSNASQLLILDIANNNFVGRVPGSLGNLQSLRALSLSNNSLGSHSANNMDFIAYLTNCSQMKSLDLSLNNFGGILPNSIANFSSNLTGLCLGSNQISGNIPATFENLVNLIILSMEYNQLTGVIPTSLGRLRNLQIFALMGNRLSGKIPSSLGNLTRISELDLSYNNLEGSIPPHIGNCKNLQYLDISKNRLIGDIPVEVFGLSSLTLLLNFSRNSLTGSLAIEVGKLQNIGALDLSENNLTNEIPETIGECGNLNFLDLHGNFFEGSLPSALASLKVLEYLDLSQNNLTGQIPKDLQNLRFLVYLNISFNDLDGEVPNNGVFRNASAISVVGNIKLCGGVLSLKLPRCLVVKSKEGNKTKAPKLTIIIICVVVIFLFSSFIFLLWRRKSTRKSLVAISTISFLSKVSYNMLYQATNGFSPNMLVGAGSFGSVYKALLGQEENPVAVKVLNLQRKGANRSFVAECNALRNARHRNLVKILTCCSSTDYKGNEFKALVYEYMSNGSLEKWLHLVVENQSMGLNLIQRLNIAIDVASAINYLHEDCDQPVIHCDLKPSNVLLDNEMVAHVGDFGLARLISNAAGISEGQSSTIGIKGTIGYAAPEYAMGGEPSKQGDAYSYGILVLEMITGRRPSDEMFKDDFNLHNFVKMALPDRLVQIVDSALLPREGEETSASREDGRSYSNNNHRGDEIEEEDENINLENTNQISTHLQKCLVSILDIGLACSKESPNERMNMEDVTRELQHIRSAYMAIGTRGERRRHS